MFSFEFIFLNAFPDLYDVRDPSGQINPEKGHFVPVFLCTCHLKRSVNFLKPMRLFTLRDRVERIWAVPSEYIQF